MGTLRGRMKRMALVYLFSWLLQCYGSCSYPSEGNETCDVNRLKVLWRLPIGCGFSGFFVEFLGYLVGGLGSYFDLTLSMGKCGEDVLNKMTDREQRLIRSLQAKPQWEDPDVVVHHLTGPCEFGQYDEESAKWLQRSGIIHVARTMSESALLTSKQVQSCQAFSGQIWVPSQFHYDRFRAQGISEEKLVVIPEAVDTELFHLESSRRRVQKDDVFIFFASSKWEQRKGWDILLRAYFSEFTTRDNVLLRIQSYVPSWSGMERNVSRHVQRMTQAMFPSREQRSELPKVEFMDGVGLSREEQREAYATVDAFVLPTRGEGWGLTVVEAMCMELPVIVTNFSGPTEYLRADNSYLLAWDGLDPSGFAQPSVPELKRLMRRAFEHSEEASSIGRAARRFIVERYDSRTVSRLIQSEILRTHERRSLEQEH